MGKICIFYSKNMQANKTRQTMIIKVTNKLFSFNQTAKINLICRFWGKKTLIYSSALSILYLQ